MMNVLFDETFASNDGMRTSRNIWYGYADFSADGEYGKEIRLDQEIMDLLCDIIRDDLSGNDIHSPTETNWYFYGNAVTQDAIGDNIRPTIMVRERSGGFTVNINISDHDFAVNIDSIISFKVDFKKHLIELHG